VEKPTQKNPHRKTHTEKPTQKNPHRKTHCVFFPSFSFFFKKKVLEKKLKNVRSFGTNGGFSTGSGIYKGNACAPLQAFCPKTTLVVTKTPPPFIIYFFSSFFYYYY
jgi:hypothetical protein